MYLIQSALNFALVYWAWYKDGLHGNWESRSFLALVFLGIIAAKIVQLKEKE